MIRIGAVTYNAFFRIGKLSGECERESTEYCLLILASIHASEAHLGGKTKTFCFLGTGRLYGKFQFFPNEYSRLIYHM